MPLTRRHHQRLREIYRSAGWPCGDLLEVELLAAGLLERQRSSQGHETLRVTDAGIHTLAQVHARNKAARTPHELLVEQVATNMAHAGRLAWRGLALRVALPKTLVVDEPPALCANELATQRDAFSDPSPEAPPNPEHAWCTACPDVFSIRRTTVQAYLEPVVHEIKVSRADLLGDLKRPAKRAAYLEMASACWYVLGLNAKGQPIAKADEVPTECGVLMVGANGALQVAREAPRRAVPALPFEVWMCLAKAGAVRVGDGPSQALL